MLTIRREQFAALIESELQSFDDWVLAHVKRSFPTQCKTRTDGDLREIIQYGRERAATYGVRANRDVCKYIDLMLILGPDFDTDPRIAWAGEILRKPRDPVAKMHFLYRAAINHIGGRKH